MSIDQRTQTGANELNWMLVNFVRATDGVRDAAAVSSDGLLIAKSGGLDRAGADHLAAIVSSLASVARSASRKYDFDGLKLIMVEMRAGFLLVSATNGGSCIGVLAEGNCDVGLVGYEVAVLAERFGTKLTPALITECRLHLPR
ncbi:MAG: roadblock/LC7 domain-containing protein [Micromonosporaceae bacterium]|nr:roadblock/LC7 domain-containing protein [Micromonosporaceae bacterium]